VGLLGFGNIPKLVTERLKPFGCKVIAYDPYVDPVMAKEEYNVDLICDKAHKIEKIGLEILD